jgi:phosphoglycerate dehydrogenase-like enzyme
MVNEKVQVLLSADLLDERQELIFPDIGLSSIDAYPQIKHRFAREYRSEYSAEQLATTDILLTLKPKITRASLEGLNDLCAIGRFGVGYDNVDLAACTDRDVAVYITRDAVIQPVASSIVLLVLALSHRLVSKDRAVRRGEWVASTKVLGFEPRARTVGTVGFGNIAQQAIRLLQGFGVARFLAYDPMPSTEKAAALGVELVELDQLLRESDYVLINCPLTPSTRKLIGERELALMKKDAVLINTARGPIVDEEALIAALQQNQIAGAGLDVFDQEPLSPDSPLVSLDNTILTSHSICWTNELFRDLGREAFAGALALCQGTIPPYVVNADVLEKPGFLKKLERLRSRFLKGNSLVTN